MKLIDANILLRYLTEDDKGKAEQCLAFFESVEKGEEEARLTEGTLCEVIFVLVSPRQYGLSHSEAAARLRPILALPGIHLTNKQRYRTALQVFARYTFLDFEDALLVTRIKQDPSLTLLSYDTDFDRLPGVMRSEP